MASIIDCLLAKASLGKVSKDAVAKIAKHIEGLNASNSHSADVIDEITRAKKALADGQFALEQKQRNIVTNIQKQKEAIDTLKAAAEAGTAPIQAMQGLFYTVQRTANSYKEGITEKLMHPLETYISNAKEKYGSRMYSALKPLGRSEITGSMDVTLNREVATGLFNLERGLPLGKISKEAQELSKELYEVSKFGSKEYKRLGGVINAEHDNMMGIRVSPEVLRGLSAKDPMFEEKFISELLHMGIDVDHINKTLRTTIQTPEDLKAFLSSIYKAMLSGGPLDKTGTIIPKEMQHVATANNLSRILRFNTPEATIQFLEKYGAGNAYSHLRAYQILRGIEDGSHEAFGPNPHATKAAILDHLKQTHPEDFAKASSLFDRYASHTGLFNAARVLNDDSINLVGATAKNIFRSALLGKVGLWQMVIDMWNLPRLTNKFKGIPQLENISKQYGELFKSHALSDLETSQIAKAGFLLEDEFRHIEDSLLTAADQGRINSVAAYGSAGTDATVQKLTGGTRSIQATIRGSEKFLIGKLSELIQAGNIDHYGQDMGNWLRSLGFTQDVANYIKTNAFHEAYFYEHPFMAINKRALFDIDTEEGRTAARVLTRVLQDHQLAINPQMPGPYAAAATEAKRAGVIQRTIAESGTALTSYLSGFATTMLQSAAETPGRSAKMKLLADYVIMAVTTGYLSTVLNDLLMGRDAPPMSSDVIAKTIGRSFGPIGDALVSGGDATSGGILNAIFPGGKFFTDIAGNTLQIGQDTIKGDFKKIPAHSVKLLSRLMPGQTAPIYGLLWKQYIENQLMQMADPEAYRKMHTRDLARETRTGSTSWWKPGELKPQRAPDLSKLTTLHINHTPD